MKKILLSMLFAGSAYFSTAQVVQVLYPANIAQGFGNSFASWAATPDMTNPANRIVKPVMIARASSGAEGDSLLCNATSQDLTGKIALVFRGSCEFGAKAKNAWNAGAAGIIIVGNVPGEVINMSAGSGTPPAGDAVTVPVCFIAKESGKTIYDALKAGDSVSVLLGNKNGYMSNDLGSIPGYTATVPAQTPVEIANNTTEFPIKFAAQIYNYGANKITGIKVIADIHKNNALLYSDTSSVVSSLIAGDSTEQFTFTDYSGALGVGDYTITYTIVSDSTDDAPSDNVFVYPFKINNTKTFALARYDYTKNFTFNSGNYRASGQTDPEFTECITFKDPNASKFGIKGVYFNASMKDSLPIDGEEVQVSVTKWGDTYTMDSPSWNSLTPITGGTYTYMSNLKDTFVYAHMQEYIMLEDNVSYLVCAKTFNENMYLGYDAEERYDMYQSIAERYLSPIMTGTTWGGGFRDLPVASLTLDLFTAEEVGLTNASKLVNAIVYPNPAKNVVNVAIENYTGNAAITVTDLAGKTVVSNDVTISSNGIVSINTSNLTAGMYIVNMTLANGNQVKASVVIE
jgi:hypothetical protein